MTESAICITKDILYAVRLGDKREFWRVTWNPTIWITTIADVIATLGTKEFHVILTDDLPSLNAGDNGAITTLSVAEDHARLIETYKQALGQLGCSPLSIQVVDDVPGETIISEITEYLPHEASHSPYQVGSLEDVLETRTAPSHLLRYLLIIFAAILLAGGSWLLFGSQILNSGQRVATSPSPTATPLPTPTPSPNVPAPKNQDYTLQIQNGSGITGLAGKLSAKLEGLGFVVKDVGNADKSSYIHGIIKSKTTLPEAIITTIETVASDSAWEKSSLSDGSPYDIVIILGQKTSLPN